VVIHRVDQRGVVGAAGRHRLGAHHRDPHVSGPVKMLARAAGAS
jgi:hypothetical protein